MEIDEYLDKLIDCYNKLRAIPDVSADAVMNAASLILSERIKGRRMSQIRAKTEEKRVLLKELSLSQVTRVEIDEYLDKLIDCYNKLRAIPDVSADAVMNAASLILSERIKGRRMSQIRAAYERAMKE